MRFTNSPVPNYWRVTFLAVCCWLPDPEGRRMSALRRSLRLSALGPRGRGARRRRPCFGVLLVVVLLAAFPSRSRALDVGETRWGFDGRATPQCFNLLSVLVSNPTPEPFEGILELRESIGGGTRVGATLGEELYVAPYSSRWVQFYPFVKERYESYSLQWGRRPGERAAVPQAVLADQQPVLLAETDDAASRGGAIRRFPENLFPPMVTATDTLKTAALDHVPRWEEARRQAFYDWLFRGGRLHLFRDANGAYPQFSAALAMLNTPSDHFRVGNGQVFRHDRLRNQIDAEFMEKTLGLTSSAGANRLTRTTRDAVLRRDRATRRSPEELVPRPAARETRFFPISRAERSLC